jgi:transposase
MNGVDSRKLARELENGSLKGIYIPTKLFEELRSLVRLRHQLVRSQARLKNQIKGYLNFYGQNLPKNYQLRHWSKEFIGILRKKEFIYAIGKKHLEILLDELIEKRARISETIKSIRKFITEYNLTENNALIHVPE